VPSRIFFCFRLFKRLQHLIADVKRVRQSFQAGRELCEFIVAKVTVRDPCCDNQNVIAEGNILLLLIADVNTLCIFIDSANFAKDYGRISLIFQKSTDRRRYLSRRKHGCRHLIEQRLKEVVIRPINDKDFRVCVSQGFAAASPANPAPTITILFIYAWLNRSSCTLLELPFD
jgi:hypothetical protein